MRNNRRGRSLESGTFGKMDMSGGTSQPGIGYQIRYQSLFQQGRALAFPCDCEGHVDLNTLTPRAMDNYLFARAMVGREFATPSVSAREVNGPTAQSGR